MFVGAAAHFYCEIILLRHQFCRNYKTGNTEHKYGYPRKQFFCSIRYKKCLIYSYKFFSILNFLFVKNNKITEPKIPTKNGTIKNLYEKKFNPKINNN